MLYSACMAVTSFLDWGTDRNSERLAFFVELFGEASENYPLYKNYLPSQGDPEKLKQGNCLPCDVSRRRDAINRLIREMRTWVTLARSLSDLG
uniref:Uncharacterized protein n=1 Tax=Candidatus Kentrum sp. DK TaxID=2126562 RepID=A0A450TDM9_9GAMM|nr:MAG: hypothetical protein BECKDK2373B_GA0170837_11441 [Candidatus Kentron sp. DK]